MAVFFGPIATPLHPINAETAASRMAMVSSGVCQSAFSRVNLHEAGPKKNEMRFSGSLIVRPCSEAFPVVMASTSSMRGSMVSGVEDALNEARSGRTPWVGSGCRSLLPNMQAAVCPAGWQLVDRCILRR